MSNRQLKNDKQVPAMIIDDSALKNMFEGKNKGKSNDMLKKLKEMNDSGMKIVAVTTLSSFLRAIWLADPKAKINKIQKTLSFLQVIPSFADFKNEEEVKNEIIEVAHILSKGTDESKKVFNAISKIATKLNKEWIGEGKKANVCICSLKSHEGVDKKIICTECKGDCYITTEDSEEVKSMKANNIKNICVKCALLNHREKLNPFQIKILEASE